MIRPTARLRFELDSEELNDDLTVDLKRSFLNVAPVHIGPRPEIKDARIAKNILGLVVVLHYPYWGEAEEQADETWNEILIPWLEKKLFKLHATVQSYNKSRRRAGKATVKYGQLEIILDNRVFAVQLPSSSSFPDEIPALISRARDLALAGVLEGEGFLRVEMPWVDVDQLPDLNDDEVMDSPVELEEGEFEEGLLAEGDGSDAAAPELQPEAEAEPEPDEAIDYSIWGIRCQDGSVRTFDSIGGAWL